MGSDQRDDDDGPDGSKLDEPRAGEYIRGETDAVDSETMERLARWFGAPAAVAPGVQTDHELEEVLARKRRIANDVDPNFLESIFPTSPWGPALPEVSSAGDRELSTFRPIAIREVEVVDLERPQDIDEHIKDDNTPQAKLRDLHRPVREFHLYYEEHDIGEAPSTISHRATIARALEPRDSTQVFWDRKRIHQPIEELRHTIRHPWWTSDVEE